MRRRAAIRLESAYALVLPDPPHGLLDALRRFWFDVTKADWRETMVLQRAAGMAGDHAAMYRFDLLQQFGWAGPLLAVVGLAALVENEPAPRGAAAAAVPRQRAVRVQLQRRRRARVLSAVAPDDRAAGGARRGVWWRRRLDGGLGPARSRDRTRYVGTASGGWLHQPWPWQASR